MVPPGPDVPTGERVSRSRERPLTFPMPAALSEHLDRMCASIEEVGGGRCHRKELVAALLATCSLTGSELNALLQEYRTMKVRDLPTFAAEASANVVRLADHRPGPRANRR
jgi:hypothetical protein